MNKELEKAIIEGYSRSVRSEWNRLSKNVSILEYLTTIHYLEKYLPKKGLVADIGSGPGRYAIWLAEQGYNVVTVDPVPKFIDFLKAKFRARKLGKRLKGAYVAYAQDLSMFKDNTFDAVICLGGPLSHIMSKAERQKAANELLRIAKPKAKIFVSVMGRLPLYAGTVKLFHSDLEADFIEEWAKTGDYYGGYGFLPFHGFRPDELQKFFHSSNSRIIAKVGLEGFASYARKEVDKLKRNKKRWEKWLKIHFSICEEPETICASEHYMLILEKR